MSLRQIVVQYVGDALYIPKLEREVKCISERDYGGVGKNREFLPQSFDSRWFELFGTPERTVNTLIGKCGDCCECVIADACDTEGNYCLLSCDGNAYRAKLLEWLRGDAE